MPHSGLNGKVSANLAKRQEERSQESRRRACAGSTPKLAMSRRAKRSVPAMMMRAGTLRFALRDMGDRVPETKIVDSR